MADETTPREATGADLSVANGNSDPPVPPENAKGSEDNSSGDSFSREYVEQLRAEAKANREKAQRADFLMTEVRRFAVKEAAASAGLFDPEALTWSDEYATADGMPDHDHLLAAAEALVLARPWLARPRGPLPGQGQHSDADQGLSLSALLRA